MFNFLLLVKIMGDVVLISSVTAVILGETKSCSNLSPKNNLNVITNI